MESSAVDKPQLSCKLCNKYFTGTVPYFQHLQSQRHLKIINLSYKRNLCSNSEGNVVLMNQASLLSKEDATKAFIKIECSKQTLNDNKLAAIQKISVQNNENINPDDKKEIYRKKSKKRSVSGKNKKAFNCKPCKKTFTSEQCYKGHIDSKIHARCLKNKELMKQMLALERKVLEVIKINPSAQSVKSDIKDLKDACYSHCDICCMSFSGPKPMTEHLSGKPHQKSVNKMKILEKISVFDPLKSKSLDKSESNFYCQICQKRFSGFVPYEEHRMSTKHKLKEEKRTAQAGYQTNVDVSKAFVENVWQNVMKKENKTKMDIREEKCKDASLISKYEHTTRSECNEVAGNSAHERISCSLCAKEFNGPESAYEHMMSEKHCKKVLKIKSHDLKAAQSNK